MSFISNELQSVLSVMEEGQIKFMEGREKGKLPQKTVVTIDQYDYIVKGTGETYPVFTIKEDEKHVFFGGQDFGKLFGAVDALGEEGKAKLLSEGLKLTVEKIETKDSRTFNKIKLVA